MIRKVPSLLLLLLLLAVLSHCKCDVSESAGFSLKLVRRSFLRAPSFPHQALDFTGGFQQQNEGSKNRASYPQKASRISDNKQNVFPDMIRPHINHFDYTVTVDASIGTPPHKKTFIFDTGSSLTWTQCLPCKNCFSQTLPLFDPEKSSSYKKMDASHPFSSWFDASKDGTLVYKEKYITKSNQTSEGITSLETFSFPSNSKGLRQSIKHIVFGCANNNAGDWPNNTPITGIMAMDRSPLSLISQIGGKSARRFSYCLPRLSSSIKTTLLRFGTDVETRSNLVTAKLLSNTYKYALNLKGISVAGHRLELSRGAAAKGCIIDTGSSHSGLETRAYNGVAKILKRHFDRFNLTRLTGPNYEGQLCYPLPPGFNSFPSMILHFKGSVFSKGADFLIRQKNLFGRVGRDVFCMTMYERADMTILGAFQMQNVRFVFDVAASKVSFGAEDCSKDKA